jgi:hypothetical protein
VKWVIILAIVALLYFSTQTPATVPAGQTGEGIGPQCGGIGGFIKGHVDRKNAVAPTVVQKYTGIDKGTAATITKYANELSISNKVEGFVGEKLGDALCNLDPLSAAAAGAKFVGKEIVAGVEAAGSAIASGADYVGTAAVSGAKAVGQFGVGIVKNPLSGVQTVNGFASKAAATSVSLSSRATASVYNALPAPLKVAAAPAYAVEKVTAKVTSTVTSGVSGVARTTTSAISSGVKSASSAVSSGVSKVLGWL